MIWIHHWSHLRLQFYLWRHPEDRLNSIFKWLHRFFYFVSLGNLFYKGFVHLIQIVIYVAIYLFIWAFSRHTGKESACQCWRYKRHRFDSWVRKSPWKRKWQPTPVFLPEKSHGQRSLVGYSPWGHRESDRTGYTHTCS